MIMAWDLKGKFLECLKENQGRRLEGGEISKWIFKTYRDDCEKKREKSKATKIPLTTDKALKNQITSEIAGSHKRFQRHHPEIKVIDGPPRQFYYSEIPDADEIEESEKEGISSMANDNEVRKIKEHDLYPLLSKYLATEFQLYSKRIDEKRSKNKAGSGGNHWLYPDIVAMEDLSAEWEQKVKDVVEKLGSPRINLWSFEVKLNINRSNVRESFFQAVSNSSWANFGYLVASQISGDALIELRILANSHGIGFIRLDVEEPESSQIIIPAEKRLEVDWSAINRIAQENTDFSNYIKYIDEFYRLGRVSDQGWNDSPEHYSDDEE